MTINHPMYIESKEQLSYVARGIINSHPMGYYGCTIKGPRGRGKTAFCMHTAREVYQFSEGLSRDSAWERVLENTMFCLSEIDNMIDRVEGIDWNNVIKWQEDNSILCRIWDDAGMHGGKFRFFTDTKAVGHLQENMDVIRLVLTGFLINAPEISNLLSFLRSYRDHKIINIAHTPERKAPYERVATIKQWREDRLGRWHLIPVVSTRFSCFVDEWVYEEVTVMKARAIIDNRKKFKDMMKHVEKADKVDEVVSGFSEGDMGLLDDVDLGGGEVIENE